MNVLSLKHIMAYTVLYFLNMICERFPGVGEWADMGFISSLGIVYWGLQIELSGGQVSRVA